MTIKNFLATNKILLQSYKLLQPLFLKNITVHSGDQTQSIDVEAHSYTTGLTSHSIGPSWENEVVSSESESKGKSICLFVMLSNSDLSG